MSTGLKIAVLGTGMMGLPMARRLAQAGHEVHAWNRTRTKAEPLAADGVTIHDNAADAVRGVDFAVSLLESGAIVFEGSQARDFFAFLLANTKEGYFSDPIHGGNKNGASWTMIGFPGARADFMDWVQRPGEAYPLPTVTIAGRQA